MLLFECQAVKGVLIYLSCNRDIIAADIFSEVLSTKDLFHICKILIGGRRNVDLHKYFEM